MSRVFLSSTKFLFTAISLFFALNAHAALVNFSVTGIVDDVIGTFSPNDFGLILNDTISATGNFDNNGLTGVGLEFVSLGSLNLIVGSATFDETDDTTGGAFPKIVFNAGVFAGINFDANFQSSGFFNSTGELGTFNGFDDNFGSIGGTWDVSSYAVPVPAAAWLFGSGLLGLVGVARRKRAS